MKDKLFTPIGIAGASLGMGIIGSELGSEGLIEGGQVAGKFISPAINITMAGYITRELRNLKKI